MSTKHVVLLLTLALLLFLPLSASAGAKCKVLHNFGSGTDGTDPNGPLALDNKANLYGVTFGGGDGCGCGTVFKLAPKANGNWKESILHSFDAGNDGALPYGTLVFDGVGNIYGTMVGDNGAGGSGVFELSPGRRDWTNTRIYAEGAGPGLLIDKLGNLYGQIDPSQDEDAIGELSPGSNGWTYTQLYSFDGTDGLGPEAPPTWDGKGNMFGTTTWGGISKAPCRDYDGCGVIYEMTPNGDGTWTYHVLHRFASSKDDGQNPYSGLVMDQAGNFYGGTWTGGHYELGTVFKLAYTGGRWQETILYDFSDCNHGCGMDGTLALDKAGNLYGTAAGGPPSGCYGLTCGVVFKLSPQKSGQWKYSVVYNFTLESGGSAPFYGVILDDKGNLFGVTTQFGKYGFGTAFEITP
jgi:uncharacterized repeat protein (TIGR03803 family)